jgi:hypothetical protein
MRGRRRRWREMTKEMAGDEEGDGRMKKEMGG